jgi:hypothetical protein
MQTIPIIDLQKTESGAQPKAAPSAEGHAPLRGIRSAQKETVRLDDISFAQVLDAINPFKHIPFVSSLSAAETTEAANPVSPMAQLAGGALLGGVIGFVGAAVNLMFQESTGQGVAGSIIDAASGKQTQMASTRYTSLADAHKHRAELWFHA